MNGSPETGPWMLGAALAEAGRSGCPEHGGHGHSEGATLHEGPAKVLT